MTPLPLELFQNSSFLVPSPVPEGALSFNMSLLNVKVTATSFNKVFWLPAPVFIMGVVATVAGGLAVLFPETLGR